MTTNYVKKQAKAHLKANLTEQILIIPAFASVTPYERSSKLHKDITDAITYHLCKNMVPADTISKVDKNTH